jgi:hypothetical protein
MQMLEESTKLAGLNTFVLLGLAGYGPWRVSSSSNPQPAGDM